MLWGPAVALGLVSAVGGGRIASGASTPVRYDGHALVRVDAGSRRSVRALVRAGARPLGHQLQPGGLMLHVPPSADAALAASGLSYTVVVPDLQARIDDERARLAAEPALPHGEAFFADFRDLAEVDGWLDTLAADRPDIAEVVELGTSALGRDIRGIRISAAGGEPAKVVVTGTVHAREWLATMSVICLADRLVHGEGMDADITEALAAVDVTIVPVMNPDGYQYSWDTDRYWRKTRRDGHGVDINRNFPVGWGMPGSSGDMSANDYRGPEALSEPESVALADFIEAEPDLVAHIDFHAFGEFVLYPWSYDTDVTEDDKALSEIAGEMADAMALPYGEPYQALQGYNLYPAAGVISDWSYGDVGLMAFTTELRPEFAGGDFVVDPAEIEPTCDEALAGTMVVLTWAAQFSEPEPGTSTGGSTSTGGTSTSTGAPVTSGPPQTSGPAPTTDPPPGDDTTAPATTVDPAGTSTQDPEAAEPAEASDGCACRGAPSGGVPIGWVILVLAAGGRRRGRREGRPPQPTRV